MKLSYSWLKDYLDFDLTPAQLADAMTSIGIEVDSVEERDEIPGGLAGVVVAQVLECEEHPDSDHLHVTKVDDGSAEPLVVVCGAPNVAAGQKVLFARIGAVLPGDFKIKKSKIRGVESFGMICAEDELGIGGGHDGIMVLPEDAVTGTPAREYLHLKTEAVIEYEITANRIDAASHMGVARDLYAYLKSHGMRAELHMPDLSAFAVGSGSGIPVDVLDHDGAPRYTGLTIRGAKVGPSPEWLQKRLLSIGSRPVDNIVDVANFVLFESGQPLHTFDAAKVGGKVVVRRAVEGEHIRTLDGVDRSLHATDMVIANADGPMCIAGVLGGEDSGVTDATVDVFLESAYFDPASIRRTAKSQGLQTDASFRYERGADPSICVYALKRAAMLIMEVAGGHVEGGIIEDCPHPVERKHIGLDYRRMEDFIGQEIGHGTIEDILTCLNYEFVERHDGGSTVAAPTYMVDVCRECDVVEEVLRIYGYDHIGFPGRMKMSVTPSPSPDPESIRNGVSNFLAANGFVETMNNSLTKGEYYAGLKTFPAENSVRIVNPLSSDLNVMRQTLLLGGLEVIAYNLNRQVQSLKTFEYGTVYRRLADADGKTLAGYEEHPCYAMFLTGTPDKSWRVQPGKGSFFALKGYLELLLRRFGADLYHMRAEAAPSDLFSEGVAYVMPGQDRQLAVIGTVDARLARKLGVKQPVFAAEISWPALFDIVKRDKVKFSEMPKFPEVRRDLALLLDESVSYADLQAAAYKSARKMLRHVSLFDVYRGDKIPAGKKQYAMSFVLQDPDRTLTDQDVEKVMGRILSTFQNAYGASLR